MKKEIGVVIPDVIEQKIILVRGQKVILDSQIAELYGVETKVLKRAVSRNKERFPEDFMLQLTREESEILRFQFGTLRWGEHSKYLPVAFTEQGIAMLSGVLRSRRAVLVNILLSFPISFGKHNLQKPCFVDDGGHKSNYFSRYQAPLGSAM
jgi:hypothetical protein